MADEQEPSEPSLEPPSLVRPEKPDEPVESRPAPRQIADQAPAAHDDGPPEPAPPESPEPPAPPRQGPVVPGRVAAAAAGLLVGALIAGLTAAAFELCNNLQGTNSCGGPGFFLLVGILVLAVVLGAVVLRLCGVGEAGITSVLAVGLTSVIALLFLIDGLFEWWMSIAIPLVSVAAFLLSHWVTATFVGPSRTDSSPADEDWFHHIR